jgi:hypothetical protein
MSAKGALVEEAIDVAPYARCGLDLTLLGSAARLRSDLSSGCMEVIPVLGR